MKKCFIFDGEEIYLEQVLIDYNGAPIFFICKGDKRHYLALCTDLDVLHYYVVEQGVFGLYRMLQGGISMRDAFLKKEWFYDIKAGDEPENDIVEKKQISEIDVTLLPYSGAVFEILTHDVESYANKLHNSIQNAFSGFVAEMRSVNVYLQEFTGVRREKHNGTEEQTQSFDCRFTLDEATVSEGFVIGDAFLSALVAA